VADQENAVSHAPRYTARVITTLAEFESLAPEWDALLEESDQLVFFLRWDWNWLWWRYFAPASAQLQIVCCRDEAGRLAGVAPFYRRDHHIWSFPLTRELVMLGTGIDLKTSEYLDVFIRRNEEQPVAQCIAAALRELPEWDRLWMLRVPINSGVMPHLIQELDQTATASVCDQAPYVDTSRGWGNYKRTLGRSMRRNSEYYSRRLFKHYDCEFRLVESPEELDSAVTDLVRLHQSRWHAVGELGAFSRPEVQSFIRDTMRLSLAAGRLRLWTLRIGGRVEAALVGFLDNGVLHYFQKGFNPAFAKDDLGTAILALSIRACCEDDGIAAFDFMGGGAPYKTLWARQERLTMLYEVSRPNVRVYGYRLHQRARDAAGNAYRAWAPASFQQARREWLRRRRLRNSLKGAWQFILAAWVNDIPLLLESLVYGAV
jgi:CelD/BcsL family acetyltransferase involved in cellulose biosynthesis